MSLVRIETVEGRHELVEMLDVKMSYPIEFAEGRDCMLVDFEGGLLFYRQPLGDGMQIQNPDALRLPLRWVPSAQKMIWAGRPGEIRFEARCDGKTIERIEEFRDGGPVHLRLEGEFRVLKKGGESPVRPEEDRWMKGVAEWLNGAMPQAVLKVLSKDHTLLAEAWSKSVLSILRHPGSFFVEFTTPHPTGKVAAEVLEHFKKGQAAFERGGYDEVARVLYIALEAVKGHVANVERPQFVKDRILDRIKALNAVCNRERHKEKNGPDEEPVKFDRALAHDALASTASLIGLLFR